VTRKKTHILDIEMGFKNYGILSASFTGLFILLLIIHDVIWFHRLRWVFAGAAGDLLFLA